MMVGSLETAYKSYANDNNMDEEKSTTFMPVQYKLRKKKTDEKPERKPR